MVARTFGRELEMIDQLEEPDQLLELFASEHLQEPGLRGQLLGRLGAPGCAELVGQSLADRTGVRDQLSLWRRVMRALVLLIMADTRPFLATPSPDKPGEEAARPGPPPR